MRNTASHGGRVARYAQLVAPQLVAAGDLGRTPRSARASTTSAGSVCRRAAHEAVAADVGRDGDRAPARRRRRQHPRSEQDPCECCRPCAPRTSGSAAGIRYDRRRRGPAGEDHCRDRPVRCDRQRTPLPHYRASGSTRRTRSPNSPVAVLSSPTPRFSQPFSPCSGGTDRRRSDFHLFRSRSAFVGFDRPTNGHFSGQQRFVCHRLGIYSIITYR
jgi:hypothetical protein